MVDSRVRVKNTNIDVLVGNLRGEVGEAITNWIIIRHLIVSSKKLQTDDIAADMNNKDLAFINVLRSRITDDLILTLAGLAEPKIGRTTFYFASQKFNTLHAEVKAYMNYIEINKLKEKRNREIAHREQPEEWPKQGDILISYSTLTISLAKAIRLMKKIDAVVMGESAYSQWHKMRKKRYDLTMPARAKYLLLPHLGGET